MANIVTVTPPRPSLPPLNALRAFESAARLGGFQQAAGELNVTAGAVAQHVKLLEAWCGTALFERQAKGVTLTPLGKSVLLDFERAFDAMSFASQRLSTLARPKNVSIAALPSVAHLLVASWLPAIRAAIEGVQVSVTAMEQPPNLAREPYDLSLFYYADPESSLIGPDVLIPVAAPSVVKGIKTIDDFLIVPHISDQSWAKDWGHWFETVFQDRAYTGSGPSYSLFSVAVEETKNAAGILMAHRSLVEPLLRDGALEIAWDAPVLTDLSLVLHRSPISGASPVIDAVVDAIKGLV